MQTIYYGTSACMQQTPVLNQPDGYGSLSTQHHQMFTQPPTLHNIAPIMKDEYKISRVK